MKVIKTTLFLLFVLVFSPTGMSADNPVNWTPQIFSNGQSYHVTFQHEKKNLKYYISTEMTEVEGEMVVATVVRYAPDVLNAQSPAEQVDGNKVMYKVYDYSETIDLTGQTNGDIIVIEVYENDIDINIPTTIGNPKGKGTLVSSRAPQGGAGG